MIHHFSTLVPHSYSHLSNLIFFLWSYYFHFSAHKLNQFVFYFAYSSHSRAELFGMESHLPPQSFSLFHALMTRSPGNCEKTGLCELSILSGFCSRQTSCDQEGRNWLAEAKQKPTQPAFSGQARSRTAFRGGPRVRFGAPYLLGAFRPAGGTAEPGSLKCALRKEADHSGSALLLDLADGKRQGVYWIRGREDSL